MANQLIMGVEFINTQDSNLKKKKEKGNENTPDFMQLIGSHIQIRKHVRRNK